jgi:hypothetical protein
MADWKRLTDTSGNEVDVNLDNVAYIIRYGDYTSITFSAGHGLGSISVSVKETPDEIHMAKPLRSM